MIKVIRSDTEEENTELYWPDLECGDTFIFGDCSFVYQRNDGDEYQCINTGVVYEDAEEEAIQLVDCEMTVTRRVI